MAAFVGVRMPEEWRPASPHQKQADEFNAEWASALRAALQAAHRT